MFEEIDLDTDIEGAAARLHESDRTEAQFTLPANRYKRKAEDRAHRRGIKKLIRPENAVELLHHLPGPGERTHCILRGDFILCDLIPAMLSAYGKCDHVRIATLGLSGANATQLRSLVDSGLIARLTLVVSVYFQQVDKATVWREVSAQLENAARLVVTRSHAKVICLPIVDGPQFIIEGSANLRSSDNLEQVVIFNDAETLDFHAQWMDAL